MLISKWWPEKEKLKRCGIAEQTYGSERKYDSLTIQNIGGFFTVIFTGILCSCVALFFEYIHFKHKRRAIADNPNSIEDTDSVPPNSSVTQCDGALRALQTNRNLLPRTSLTFRSRKSLPYF